MKKLLSSLLAVVMLLSTLSCLTATVSASYDSFLQARSMIAGEQYIGTIQEGDTADYYKITLDSSSRLSINFNGFMNTVYFRFYNETFNEISGTWYNANSGGVVVCQPSYHLTKGTYYIQISRYSSYNGDYTISYESVSAEETFSEGIGGADNSFIAANEIAFNKLYKGQIATNDSVDYYKFTIDSSSATKIEFNGYMSTVYFRLYNETFNEISGTWYNANSAGVVKLNPTYQLTKGTYYVQISRYSSYNGNYDLKVSAKSVGESFVETTGGTNNSFEAANSISLGKTYKGQIALNDSIDYYKFTVSDASELNLTFNASMGRLYFRIFDAGFNQLESNRLYSNDAGVIEVSTNRTLPAGTYYIQIAKDGYEGTYNLNISKYIAPTSVTSIANGSSGLTIKWSAVTGAEGYYVYRKAGSGSYSKLATVKGGTKVSYTDKTAKSGTKYSYYVKAYSGSTTSAISNAVTSVRLSKPAMKSIANASTGVTVKWGKITGASGYYVYRKTGSGSYSKIATVKGGSTLSYTDKTAKSGSTYSYYVKAYNGNNVSASASAISIKFLATPKATVANASTGVTVKWAKVTGAKGYTVYRKASGEKSWTKLANTTKTSYTDKKAKAGVTYTYTVKAYNGNYVSAMKSSSSIEFLKAPALKSVSSGKSGVTVKWAKSTGADGYYVYRRTGSGSYTKIATVKGSSKVSYLDKSAKKGNTYTYYVKAYSGKSVSTSSKTLKIKDKY